MGTQKTISLDEKTAIIASRMPNFSRWVRQRLIEHALRAPEFHTTIQEYHIAPHEARVWGENSDKCNARHKDGLCPTCYPEGEDA